MFQQTFNQTTLIAPKRQHRPMIDALDTSCPFCLENKNQLENIIEDYWQEDKLVARIVENKYPVIGEVIRGLHDVVIDTASHTEHPKDFTVSHWIALLMAMQKRWHHMMQDPKIEFIQIFKNYGSCAGASISHSHWQMIALEQIPYSIYEKYNYFNKSEKCYFCSKNHYNEGYLIWEGDTLEIWAPPAPQFLYEVWFIPKQHHQHYGTLSNSEIQELGIFLKYLLEIYHLLNPDYAFNICMMSGDVKGQFNYHFYTKLVMRIGHIAGFEIATGCNIVTTNPKEYAKQIKALLKERVAL